MQHHNLGLKVADGTRLECRRHHHHALAHVLALDLLQCKGARLSTVQLLRVCQPIMVCMYSGHIRESASASAECS